MLAIIGSSPVSTAAALTLALALAGSPAACPSADASEGTASLAAVSRTRPVAHPPAINCALLTLEHHVDELYEAPDGRVYPLFRIAGRPYSSEHFYRLRVDLTATPVPAASAFGLVKEDYATWRTVSWLGAPEGSLDPHSRTGFAAVSKRTDVPPFERLVDVLIYDTGAPYRIGSLEDSICRASLTFTEQH